MRKPPTKVITPKRRKHYAASALGGLFLISIVNYLHLISFNFTLMVDHSDTSIVSSQHEYFVNIFYLSYFSLMIIMGIRVFSPHSRLIHPAFCRFLINALSTNEPEWD